MITITDLKIINEDEHVLTKIYELNKKQERVIAKIIDAFLKTDEYNHILDMNKIPLGYLNWKIKMK